MASICATGGSQRLSWPIPSTRLFLAQASTTASAPFFVRARDRVCIAVTDRECLAGQKVELPPFTLINGGFIAGQVVNASTGQPITATEQGRPIEIGLLGPSHPLGKVVSPTRMATVDRDGRYTLRAAPGALLASVPGR